MGLAAASMLFACKTQKNPQATIEKPVLAQLDLVNVKNDKVWVTVDPAEFKTESTIFNIPKTVPGTYSEDNYGKFAGNMLYSSIFNEKSLKNSKNM